MKKLSFLFALMALMASLAACNRSEDRGVEREEDSVMEETGRDMREGVENAGDRMEDAADDVDE